MPRPLAVPAAHGYRRGSVPFGFPGEVPYRTVGVDGVDGDGVDGVDGPFEVVGASGLLRVIRAFGMFVVAGTVVVPHGAPLSRRGRRAVRRWGEPPGRRRYHFPAPATPTLLVNMARQPGASTHIEPFQPCGTTATGQGARCSAACATEPMRPPTAPRLALRPTTRSWAAPEAESSTCPALPSSTCSVTGTSG